MAQVPTSRKPAVPTLSTTPRSKASTKASNAQRALVVGISGYPAPIPKLPAVAADVREVAKVLSSKNGTFPGGVTTLTEKQATRDGVLASLKAAFVGAKADDTIFVYLAGHGGISSGAYYFVAHDTRADRLAETGVPLAEIKRLFDRTASKRVFLWLDFCHSGGIAARGTVGDDLTAIRREIGVLSGTGKVILAACTPSQSAYEDASIGHGLFTHALLQGLKGAAVSAQGEVTALSLYEYIDHQVKHPEQQPTFFGQMAGRVVLAYYPATAGIAPQTAVPPTAAKSPPQTKAVTKSAPSRITSSADRILLDGRIYVSKSIREESDTRVKIEISPRDAEEEAALRSLKGERWSSKSDVRVAFGNQGFNARVEDVTFESAGAKTVGSVTLRRGDASTSYLANMGYNGMTAAQLAGIRAKIVLLGEQHIPPTNSPGSFHDSFITSPLREVGLAGAVFPPLYKTWKGSGEEFMRAARLWAVYSLKASGVCDDILELSLGPIRGRKLAVAFRGRRKSQSTDGPQEIVVKGDCSL